MLEKRKQIVTAKADIFLAFQVSFGIILRTTQISEYQLSLTSICVRTVISALQMENCKAEHLKTNSLRFVGFCSADEKNQRGSESIYYMAMNPEFSLFSQEGYTQTATLSLSLYQELSQILSSFFFYEG